MIPSTNSSTQIRFNYINQPVNQHHAPIFQNFNNSPIKIEENVRNSQQKQFTFEACSSLQLQTCKNFKPQNQISQKSIKSVKSIKSLEGIQKVQSNFQIQAQQSLQKAEELDPVPETTSSRMSIPILKMQSIKDEPPKFRLQNLQQIRQSDFFNNNKNGPQSSLKQSQKLNSQINQPYNSNPYSNLYTKGGQNQHDEFGQSPKQGKRQAKQIKTFKIEKIEQRKESEFTGCCGFSLSDKVSFLSKGK